MNSDILKNDFSPIISLPRVKQQNMDSTRPEKFPLINCSTAFLADSMLKAPFSQLKTKLGSKISKKLVQNKPFRSLGFFKEFRSLNVNDTVFNLEEIFEPKIRSLHVFGQRLLLLL